MLTKINPYQSIILNIDGEFADSILRGEVDSLALSPTPSKITSFPYTCYIYCSKAFHKTDILSKPEWNEDGTLKEYKILNDKVIAKFQCDRIVECETTIYGNKLGIKAIHIANLEAFEKPLELFGFLKVDGTRFITPPKNWAYCREQIVV